MLEKASTHRLFCKECYVWVSGWHIHWICMHVMVPETPAIETEVLRGLTLPAHSQVLHPYGDLGKFWIASTLIFVLIFKIIKRGITTIWYFWKKHLQNFLSVKSVFFYINFPKHRPNWDNCFYYSNRIEILKFWKDLFCWQKWSNKYNDNWLFKFSNNIDLLRMKWKGHIQSLIYSNENSEEIGKSAQEKEAKSAYI